MTDSSQLESVFFTALEKRSPADRNAYLDEVGAMDQELRHQVERMLSAQVAVGSFLESPAIASAETTDTRHPTPDTFSERPGVAIGPYKLLQQIGEGGMGVVFMAEQTHPVQRTVALKIIKPGMDTRQVIARFEAERQALAMMDHPNIARVLDAGTTDAGRPYFVMELVKGIPITKYCDDKQLSLRQRLELFKPVCEAVQHAHQKGIIHRDLKPSNVLVAEYDGKPVPKVIDFGVAKATAQRLTVRTLFTEFGQVIGTVEYMSPEQAKLYQLDIDTRSDIYSLGVLLYELLTASTPFEAKQLREAAFDEVLRIIREDEPPKPSTRLTSGEKLPSIAANRHTEPARLSKDVHGDLDWIVMKALEKDRARRYDSAANFAADIERHLRDEPVQAGRPSAIYRFRKFAKRNRTPLAAGTLLTLAVLAALGGIASGIWEGRARQARVTGQLEMILAEVARLEQAEKWHEALMTARRVEPALAAGEAAPEIQQRARQALADLELIRRLEEIRAQSGTAWGSSHSFDTTRRILAARADQDYAATMRDAGIDVDTLPLNEVVDRIKDRKSVSAAVLPALDDWVAVRSKVGNEPATRRLIDVLRKADPDPWRQRVRDCLARNDWSALENLAKSPDLDRQPAATLSFLCAALRQQAELEVDTPGHEPGELGHKGFVLEIDILRRAQQKYPDDFWINHRLGVSLIYMSDRIAEGTGYMRAAVAVRPSSSHAMSNLGNAHFSMQNDDQAIACYRRAIALDPKYWGYHSNLAQALGRTGRYAEAMEAYEQAINVDPDGAASAYARFAMLLSNCPTVELRNPTRASELADKATQIGPNAGDHWTALGAARYRNGQWEASRAALHKSLDLGTGGLGGDNFEEKEAINWYFLAMANWQMGEQEQARQCYDRAVEQMNKNAAHEDQLLRLQSEAEELLNVADDKPATKPESK
jgi:serine/threonine protein kinase/Flp pilus assembly protein TadD